MNWRNDLLHWGTPFLLAASSEALNVLQGDSAITWQAAVRAVLMAGLGAVLAACTDPAECRRILRTEILHACAALSKPLELLPEDPAARAQEVPARPPLPPPVPASYGRAGR